MQEAVGNLDRLLESFAVEIEAFLNGGPRLREKHLKEAEEAGLDPDGLANLADAWGNALAKREKAEAAPPISA